MSWSKGLSVLALCLIQDLPYVGSLPPPAILTRLDFSCALRTWKIKGVLWCPWQGNLKPCLWVENAYPCGLLEVVRQPLKSHVVGLPFSVGLTTSGHNEGQVQFAEARVFTFVPPVTQQLEIPIAAPSTPKFMVNYVSELDAFGWRTGLTDLLFTKSGDCAGKWGCFSPRRGFVEQSSEVIAAHLQALRGGRVASMPFGRVVLFPYEYEPRLGHFLQMVSPTVRSCVSIGYPDLSSLEAGGLSPYGAYLFVHWAMFDECRRCLPPRLLPPRPPSF